MSATRALRRLLASHRARGEAAVRDKLAALDELEQAPLPRSSQVLAFHDALCFLRAYPDDEEVLHRVERLLSSFASRTDLGRHAEALADTGIAGTPLHAEFYWFTARWLARRWPDRLTVDWPQLASPEKLDALMYPILQEHERLAYEGSPDGLREIVDRMRAPDETDATYLVRCFERVSSDPLVLEQVYDDLGMPLRLDAGPDAPNRTVAAFPVDDVAYQPTPLATPSGTVEDRIREAPLRVTEVSRAAGRRLVELGRGAMITRGRDLFAFMHADARDAAVADFDDGLRIAVLGLPPERRHLLYGQYILLALKNGVPAGYVQACTLHDSAEVNFNVFETFRGAEASRIFTASLALIRHLFGVDAFCINTQQLGDGNPEALQTGAWWFYYKHGFRPDAAELRPVVRRELAAKRRDPSHRSSMKTLRRLATRELFLFLRKPRREIVGKLDPAAIGAAVTRRVGVRLGVSGASAVERCSEEARRLLGVRSLRSWSAGERLAWRRWSPLVVALPRLGRWSRDQRRALVAVIRAKGGRRELEYVLRFSEHAALRRAIGALEADADARR